MRRLVYTVGMMTALAASVLPFAGSVAAASAPEEYRAVMQDFVPTIENWGTQADMALDAAVAKPELACSAEMAELAFVGQGIADDLVGTADKAPKSLMTAHYDLTTAVANMAQAGRQSCADSAAAAKSFEFEKTHFDTALAQIKLLTENPFIVGPRGPGITPGRPGPG